MKAHRPRFSRILALILGTIVLFGAATAVAAVRMGFVGGRNPEDCVRQWLPLLDYLTREIGEPVEMVLREDYEGLIEALRTGEVDLFEGGAFSHVAAMETGQAGLLAGEVRDGQTTYRSAFIVRKDDPARSIGDLRGRRFALTDEYSASGYLVPRLTLARAGVGDPSAFFRDIVLTGSHDRSIQAVLEGTVDAAAVGDFFVALLPPGKGEALRVIATSEPIPTGPITVRRDFDSDLASRIQKALFDFGERVPADIRRITEVEAFIPQDEKDFDAIRAYARESKTLPKLAYAAPYFRVPVVLADRIAAAKHEALWWMLGSFVVFFLILGIAAATFRNRLSTSIGVLIAALVAIFAAIFSILHGAALFSSMDAFGARMLGDLQNMNLRAVAAASAQPAEAMRGIIAQAVEDGAVAWARVFQNGTIIASSDSSEIGVRIIDRIRTNTFEHQASDTVPVADPIFVSGRRWATLQVGIPLAPVQAMVRRALAINATGMLAALAIGIAAAWAVRRRLASPIFALASAVESMREGEAAPIIRADAEMAPVAAGLAKLGAELAEKETLVGLKAADVCRPAKAWDPEVTREIAERIRAMEAANPAFLHLRRTETLGNSPAWIRTLRDAAIRARDRAPAVIVGPTGAGKTGVARTIHALSPRADRPFGEFNCAEFVSGDPLIVLGRLFGYGTDCGIQGIDRRGQKGILEEHDGGTLFFDEVALLPLQAQQLLLLPLEGRTFNPAAGKGAPKLVNVRFLFATNEPLEVLVHIGRMRTDFLRRIMARGFIEVPPLAERRDDIEALAAHFLARRNAAAERVLALSPETMAILARCSFGRFNVSELAGAVDQAFDNASFDNAAQIEPRHLGEEVLEAAGVAPPPHPEASSPEGGAFDAEEREELAALRAAGFNITNAERRLGYAEGAKTLTNRFRGIAYRALERNGWNVDAAVLQIAGSAASEGVVARLRIKVADYLATARRHLEANSTDKLFNNLPQKYHALVEAMLAAMKAGRL